MLERCSETLRYQCRDKAKSACLGIGSGGVGDEGVGRLPVPSQAGDQLGGVAVKVVADIRQADLAAVQVLEGHVHCLHGRLKRIPVGLTASTRPAAACKVRKEHQCSHILKEQCSNTRGMT